jgi:hypothetical protein
LLPTSQFAEARDLVEERGVEIDLLVGRTIERPHGALRRAAAGRPRHAAVQHEDGSAIGLAVLGEHVLPLHVGAVQHLVDETAHLILRGASAPRAGRRLHLRLGLPVQHLGAADQHRRVDAKRPAEEAEHHHGTDA